MTTQATPQQFTFQAEIKRLLHLLSHSLYQHREIAIRELISNASDALDKFRHVSLLEKQHDDGTTLAIDVEPDEAARVLSIRDNGIGMTHDELVKNLGTIAHSGSLEFLNRARNESQELSLIGQFGVGFYSAFMLADKVEVLSRSYQETDGWKWESDGTGNFTIESAEGLDRGTQIRLHLKADLNEYLQPVRLRHILQQYSTFVSYPIRLKGEQVNDQKPIWVEPKSQVTDEQYQNFYGFLSKRMGESPLWHLHLSSDSPFQFHAILYCPEQNDEPLGFGKIDHGIHLCAKRVLVQDNCRELLPEYLRFLFGLVDSADLPLNVSREALQDNTVFRKIRKVLVKRVLTHLEEQAQGQPDAYRKFYLQFGAILREGVAQDFENRDALAKLLRFRSSHGTDRDALIGLDQYVGRMPESQKQIYYVGGPDVRTIEKNPNLEAFRARGLEVLYLIDPVDEFVLNHLHRFADKPLVSIEGADVELAELPRPAEASSADAAGSSGAAPAGLERVIDLFKQTLGERVHDVRSSKRLTNSACCLVSPEGALSAQLERVLRTANEQFPESKRIFEINPQHPLIARLCMLSASNDQEDFIRTCGLQLYSNLLILDGNIADPHEITDRVTAFMQELAHQRSPITIV